MQWIARAVDEKAISGLLKGCSFPPPLAHILSGRGITSPEAARVFLQPRTADLHDPYLMDGMKSAVERLALAFERKERILLFGDYDVDGVSATAAMGKVLESIGLRYSFCHPDRLSEGYGFNRRGARLARESGAALIITLDCGTESVEPIAESRSLGIDTIVIDHHIPRGELPPAAAIVNPKKGGCPYPFRDLVSASLVLKFARALVEKIPIRIPWSDLLQLAALATIADVAPLREENRIIAILGLQHINNDSLPGISALGRAAALRVEEIKAGHLAFQIAPRLNAAGRIGNPAAATRLLLESDNAVCAHLADELNALNRERQSMERAALEEALEMIGDDRLAMKQKILVVAGKKWHRGVSGIVAARILEKYRRPTLVIALDGEMGYGSARSIPEFDIFSGLRSCGDLFRSFGGHTQAAGFSIPAASVDPLRRRINEIADGLLSDGDLEPKIAIDAEIRLREITADLVSLLKKLEPFGAGNPQPIIASRRVRLARKPRAMGRNGEHIKFACADEDAGSPPVECVGWRMAERLADLREGVYDMAFTPQMNEWNNLSRVQLVLRDIMPSGTAC